MYHALHKCLSEYDMDSDLDDDLKDISSKQSTPTVHTDSEDSDLSQKEPTRKRRRVENRARSRRKNQRGLQLQHSRETNKVLSQQNEFLRSSVADLESKVQSGNCFVSETVHHHLTTISTELNQLVEDLNLDLPSM